MIPGDVVQHFILFGKSGMFASQTFEPEKVGKKKICEKKIIRSTVAHILYMQNNDLLHNKRNWKSKFQVKIQGPNRLLH